MNNLPAKITLQFMPFRCLVLLLRNTQDQFMMGIGQFRFQQIDPRDIQIGTPLRESIQLLERLSVDAVFHHTSRRSGGTEQTDGLSLKFKRQLCTGLFGLQHGHIHKPATFFIRVIRMPRIDPSPAFA